MPKRLPIHDNIQKPAHTVAIKFHVPQKHAWWYKTRLQASNHLRNRDAESLAERLEDLGRDFITAVAAHSQQKTCLVVVLEQGLVVFLEALESLLPHFRIVVSAASRSHAAPTTIHPSTAIDPAGTIANSALRS